MAQKIQVLLIDDINGSEASETVSFGLDGVAYEIDLSSGNAGKLRTDLAPYVEHARKSGGPQAGGRRDRADRDQTWRAPSSTRTTTTPTPACRPTC